MSIYQESTGVPFASREKSQDATMWRSRSGPCLRQLLREKSEGFYAHCRSLTSGASQDDGVKLYYWPVKGNAEPIRMCLAYKDVRWEEPEVPFMTFGRNRELYPFGQLPRYEEQRPQAISIVQSQAILRHVGRKHQMYGGSNKERAFVDMLVGGCFDLRRKFKRFAGMERPGRSCQLDSKWQYINTVLAKDPFQSQGASMVAFEHLLEQHCDIAGQPFVLGGEPGIADMYIAYLFDIHEEEFGTKVLQSFPQLRQHRDRVFALPRLSTYIQNRRSSYLWAPDWLAAEKQLDPLMLPQIAQHVIECS